MQRIWPIIFILFGCTCQNSDKYIGTEYLGTPYISDPLGEGFAPDPDPTIRFDAFDCTTFVETVLADGDSAKLNRIRYKDAVPNLMNRNHFIETDWLTNNSEFVTDVTKKYGATRTRRVVIDKQNWFKQKYNIDTNIPPQTVKLEYIPYKAVPTIQVQEPMIILFIAGPGKIHDKIGTDLAIRHMGFLLPNGKLRHASYVQGRVVDVNFSEYVKQIMENKNNLGIMILRIKNEKR